MKKILLLLIVLATTLSLFSGCKSKSSGSREFIPGKGWQATD